TDLTFGLDGFATVSLTGGTLKINADGDFVFTYTGSDISVGGADFKVSFDYTISDGHDHTDSATVHLCIDADAGSPGYWTQQHSLADSENLPADLLNGTSTFDDFFNLDDGVGPVTNRTWTISGNPQDITLQQALGLSGSGNSVPDLTGNENALAKQAAAAVANYYDADGHDAFVAAYIYQRQLF